MAPSCSKAVEAVELPLEYNTDIEVSAAKLHCTASYPLTRKASLSMPTSCSGYNQLASTQRWPEIVGCCSVMEQCARQLEDGEGRAPFKVALAGGYNLNEMTNF